MARFARVVPRLPVADLGRSRGFYVEHLGFRACEPEPGGDPDFLVLVRDGVELQLERDEARSGPGGGDEPPVPGSTLSFEVDDAGALHRRFAGRVAVEWGPEVYGYGRRELAIRDPDGHLLILSEPTDESPTCGGREGAEEPDGA